MRRRVLQLVAAAAVVGVAAAVAAAAGKPPPPKDKWPPGAVDIATVSNGCGPGAPGTAPHWSGQDTQTYTRDDGEKITVSFRDACNLHDAAYSGALVWDPINGGFVDFSDPKWTKATINEKFKHDLQRLCFRQVPQQPVWEKVTLACLTNDDVVTTGPWGALSYYRIVTNTFSKSPRERIKLRGEWKNTNPGFPVCDVGANPWTMNQVARKVTARWKNGTAGESEGRFEGTFITGDSLGDDRVDGTYTIVDGNRVVAKGTMDFVVHSDEKFDFKGSGPVGSGTMVRVERDTQGSATKCRKPPPPPPPGTFTLRPALTEVKNPNSSTLKINAAGGTAFEDHTGPNGGAGNGGDWQVNYSWKIPQTLTPGKSASLTIGLAFVSVNPSQPLLMQIGALAPDFAQAVQAHWPETPKNSKTYTVPISAGLKDSNEILVTIGMLSANVVYHYRK